MGWLEAQERYRQGRTLTDQAVEDLVARRVLRGLGLVQKDLPKVERTVFGDADFDEAIWPRVLRLMKYALTAESYGYYVQQHVFECYDADGTHKDILERIGEVPDNEVTCPVFLTRITKTTTSMTYSIWPREDLPLFIRTPFSAIAEKNAVDMMGFAQPCLIIVQETEHFIKQFMQQQLFTAAAERAANA